MFALVGALRGGDKRAVLAAAAWGMGFETAYQLTALLMGTSYLPSAAPALIVPGLVVVPFAARRGVAVSRRFVLLTAAIWLLWLLLGFHANQHETPDRFSALTEALNESAKTAWALAYLWPLRPVAGFARLAARAAGARSPSARGVGADGRMVEGGDDVLSGAVGRVVPVVE